MYVLLMLMVSLFEQLTSPPYSNHGPISPRRKKEEKRKEKTKNVIRTEIRTHTSPSSNGFNVMYYSERAPLHYQDLYCFVFERNII